MKDKEGLASSAAVLECAVTLLSNGANVNAMSPNGSALHMAIATSKSKHQLSLLSELLSRGADVNLICTLSGEQPTVTSPGTYDFCLSSKVPYIYVRFFSLVLEAAEHGRLEILKLLKKLKIPFDKVATIQGTSCLSLATRLNNESALQLLLAQPSLDRDVHFGDAIIGQNALARACRNGNLRVRTCCHTYSSNKF